MTIDVPDRERSQLSIGIERAFLLSGLSKGEFARRIGIGPSTLNLWIRDRTKPSDAKLTRLAQKCGVTQDWLRNGGRDVA